MFMKEDFVPASANRTALLPGPGHRHDNRVAHRRGDPLGRHLDLRRRKRSTCKGSDPEIGILYVFAMVGIGVYGIMLGGWASNNKFALLGAIRAASQMVSYELAMGLSIVALVMMTGTLSLGGIVDYQVEHGWNIIHQPLGFLIFIVCAFAECNRAPFDMPECETELVGGTTRSSAA
jgi:NADH-quinone oxidoreductase subunit H